MLVACPADPLPWDEVGANCELVVPSCPESELIPGTLMRLSLPPTGLSSVLDQRTVQYMIAYSADALEYPRIAGMFRYPEFCEERHLDNDRSDPAYLIDPTYDRCQTMTRVVFQSYKDPPLTGLEGCRIIRPIECAVGLARVGSRTCRAVQRRLWTCPPNYTPHIKFNQCYQPPSFTGATHPACGQGAPNFVVATCKDYVGNDFIQATTTVVCGTEYPTGTPATKAGAATAAVAGAPTVLMKQNYNNASLVSSDYWCAYDSRYLRSDCHRTDISPPDCTTSLALCIRRATETGGCDLIAETIGCKALEAAFAQTAVTAADTIAQGCSPCTILPFEPVPSRCPSQAALNASVSLTPSCSYPHRNQSFECWGPRLLRIKQGYSPLNSRCYNVATAEDLANTPLCPRAGECAAPPSGLVDWASNHFSKLAVVNSPVVISIHNIPYEKNTQIIRKYSNLSRDSSDPFTGRSTDVAPNFTPTTNLGGIGVDQRWRTFAVDTTNSQFSGIDDMIKYECQVQGEPLFQVTAQELWPDDVDDYNQILALFGSNSLDWWNNLSVAKQKLRTDARGLPWWPDLTTTADRQARKSRLATAVACSVVNRDRACVWLPARPGYYTLTGASAWKVRRAANREWGELVNLNPRYLRNLNRWLRDSNNVATLRAELNDSNRNQYNVYKEARTPAEVGLTSNLSGPVPIPAAASTLPDADDWLYTEDAGQFTACSNARDFRVRCSSGGEVGYYAETEPVGIIVHAVRVSTVSSSP